jgi:hypothetical protein
VELKEIIVKRDGVKLRFGNKNIFLVYRIREYKKIQNQSKVYINRLRKNKEIIKYFSDSKKGFYYKLYSEKIIPLDYRRKLIDKILKKEYKDGLSLENYIYKKYESWGFNSDNINIESVILDVLGYYLSAGFQEDFVNDDVYKHEVASFDDIFYTDVDSEEENGNEFDSKRNKMYIYDNYKILRMKRVWQYQQMSKERYRKWIKKHKAQHKRWKQTSTYKFGILFTYDNHKDKIKDWDWINERWIDYSDCHVRIERLIDPERPYIFEWCYVDTDNVFTFKGKKYRISDEVMEYQKRDVRERDHRLEYPLDHIIVLEQDGNVYFFNSYGDRINNDLIKEVS